MNHPEKRIATELELSWPRSTRGKPRPYPTEGTGWHRRRLGIQSPDGIRVKILFAAPSLLPGVENSKPSRRRIKRLDGHPHNW